MELETGSTTFNVPDLRGEFLRGAGTNAHTNQGNGGSVGEHQDSTEIPNFWVSGNGTQFSFYTQGGDRIGNNDSSIVLQTENRRDASLSGGYGSGSQLQLTIRPTNTSVLYCIKY